MQPEVQFESYLERIGDDLLQSVAADCAGLESLFRGEDPGRQFALRRQACRSECLRRHRPELFRQAQSLLGPDANTAA